MNSIKQKKKLRLEAQLFNLAQVTQEPQASLIKLNQKKKLSLNAKPLDPSQGTSQLQQPYGPRIHIEPFDPQYTYQKIVQNHAQSFKTKQYYIIQQQNDDHMKKEQEQNEREQERQKQEQLEFEIQRQQEINIEIESLKKEQEQQEQQIQQQLLKQQEDEIKQQDVKERQPKAYMYSEIRELLVRCELQDFEYFNQAEWKIILGRTAHEIKERGDGINLNNKPRIFPRKVPDVRTKVMRDEMRRNLNWLGQQNQKDNDEKEKIKKDIKFWLNIISPDNYEIQAEKLSKVLISNPELSDYFADRILEKSQMESKYRELYSNLCSKLTKEPQVLNKNTNKMQSVFRRSILDRVQQSFEQRKDDLLQDQNLPAEQKVQVHIQRKNKFMGNVQFIGDLYKKQVLPLKVIDIAFQQLTSDFLEKFDPKHNEEAEIESIVVLLDQVAQHYEMNKPKQSNSVQQYVDEVEILQVLDGQSKSKADLAFFFLKYEKVICLDFMFRVLHILQKQYNISIRVSILIDNLNDRRTKGWKETLHQQGQSAKSTSQIQQENLQLEQKIRKPQYVALYKPQEPDDYSDISQRIDITFKFKSSDPEALSDELKDCLKTVVNDIKGQIMFFEEFFKRIFREQKQNLNRAKIVQILICSDITLLDAVYQSSKKIFSHLVYDLIESKYGAKLLVYIIVQFLNEEMYEQLNYLHFRPPDDNEEYQEFLTSVILELIQTCPDKQEHILRYSEKALRFQIKVN